MCGWMCVCCCASLQHVGIFCSPLTKWNLLLQLLLLCLTSNHSICNKNRIEWKKANSKRLKTNLYDSVLNSRKIYELNINWVCRHIFHYPKWYWLVLALMLLLLLFLVCHRKKLVRIYDCVRALITISHFIVPYRFSIRLIANRTSIVSVCYRRACPNLSNY